MHCATAPLLSAIHITGIVDFLIQPAWKIAERWHWDCPGSLVGASIVSVGWKVTGTIDLTPMKVPESVPRSYTCPHPHMHKYFHTNTHTHIHTSAYSQPKKLRQEDW